MRFFAVFSLLVVAIWAAPTPMADTDTDTSAITNDEVGAVADPEICCL
jgi:hypothetical protein